MKVFLDTSYFLSLISFKVKGFSRHSLLKLLKNDAIKIKFSSITNFELMAKGAKFSAIEQKLTQNLVFGWEI